MKLSADQQAALDSFKDFYSNSDQIFVLEGFSGTGKSTVLGEFIKYVQQYKQLASMIQGKQQLFNAGDHDDIVCTATTNDAAASLEAIIGREVKTIYSVLGIIPVKNYSTGKEDLKQVRNHALGTHNLLIIDEASMIDKELLGLIEKMKLPCKIIYVGDPFQLLKVGATGAPVFEDTYPDIKASLSTNQRQAQTGQINNIALLGEGYRQAQITGVFPDFRQFVDDRNVFYCSGDEFQTKIEDMFGDPAYDKNDGRLMTLSNSRVIELNNHIRDFRGYSEQLEVGEIVKSNKPIFSLGRNKRGGRSIVASTGTIHKIRAISSVMYHKGLSYRRIDLHGGITANVPVSFNALNQRINQAKKQGDYYAMYEWQELFSDLRPLYSSTVHKAQGISVDEAFLDLSGLGAIDDPDFISRFIYVGSTRAKHKLHIYGDLPKKYGGSL